MTKTITEQWKNGELIFGKTYWCSDGEGNVAKLVLVSEDRFYEWTLGTEATKDVKEVLAPVPNYDEYKELVRKADKLEEQLEIAKEALEYYADETDWMGTTLNNSVGYYEKAFLEDNGYEVAQKALKEMEGVK